MEKRLSAAEMTSMALLGEALLPMLPPLLEARVRVAGVEGETLVLAVRGADADAHLDPYLEQILGRAREFGLELTSVRIKHEGAKAKGARDVERALKKLADPRAAPRLGDPLHHMPAVLSHAAKVDHANRSIMEGFPELMRANVRVGEVDGGVLVLLASAAAWASRIRLSQGDFLARARAAGIDVESVRIRVVPSMATAPEVTAAQPPKQEPTARAREAIAQLQAFFAQQSAPEPEPDREETRRHALELAQIEAELRARAQASKRASDPSPNETEPPSTPRRPKRPRRRGTRS